MNPDSALRAHILSHLRADPDSRTALNGVFEERPVRASTPYAVLTECTGAHWGGQAHEGRELRIGIAVQDEGPEPARLGEGVAAVEEALARLPDRMAGWRIVTFIFQRSRMGRDAGGRWTALLDYRARIERLH